MTTAKPSLDSRCRPNDRKEMATTRHSTPSHLLDCKAECCVNQMLGGISLPTVDFFLFSSHPHHQSRKLGRKFLVPVWQLHDIVPITSTVAPGGAGDDTTANNLNCSSDQTLAEETGPNCGANGTDGPTSGRRGESAACKRGWINHVITERDNTGLDDVSAAHNKKSNNRTPFRNFSID